MKPTRIYTYGSYPDAATSVPMQPGEPEKLLKVLEARRIFSP